MANNWPQKNNPRSSQFTNGLENKSYYTSHLFEIWNLLHSWQYFFEIQFGSPTSLEKLRPCESGTLGHCRNNSHSNISCISLFQWHEGNSFRGQGLLAGADAWWWLSMHWWRGYYALITWLDIHWSRAWTCTDHVADHVLITFLIVHWSRELTCTNRVAYRALIRLLSCIDLVADHTLITWLRMHWKHGYSIYVLDFYVEIKNKMKVYLTLVLQHNRRCLKFWMCPIFLQ